MRREVYHHNFLRGLETTGLEDGLEQPAWSTFQNTRVSENAAKRRAGMQRILKVAQKATALDFNGTDEYISVPSNPALFAPARSWTLKTLVEPDTVTGTQVIMGWGSASYPLRLYLDGTAVKCDLVLAGGTVTISGGTAAINTPLAISVSFYVSSTTITSYLCDLWVNGTKVSTATAAWDTFTVSDNVLYFARESGGNYFNGTIDFIRMLRSKRATHEFGKMRLPDPKAADVVWDYSMEVANATTKRVDDRSRARWHGVAVNAPTSVSPLCVQVEPVSLIAQRVDYSNKSKVELIAGRSIYTLPLESE